MNRLGPDPIMRHAVLRITACATLLGWLVMPIAVNADQLQPRPIQAAERAAIELVLEHLRGNPDAWWLALSAGSSLRVLGRETASAEIAVRLGPAKESRWNLATSGPGLPDHTAVFAVELASGVTDYILLGMREENGDWKLDTVRCLVDSWQQQTDTHQHAQLDLTSDASRASGSRARTNPTPLTRQHPRGSGRELAWPLLALSLALLASISRRRTPATTTGEKIETTVMRRATPAGLALCFVGLVIVACEKTGETAEIVEREQPTSTVKLLSSLAPLRSALAGQGDRVATAANLVVPASLAAEAASWQLQDLLLRAQPAAARAAYRSLPPGSSKLPLNAVLALDLAYLEGDEARANAAYVEGVELGLDIDAFHFEAAGTFAALGDPVQPRTISEKAAHEGSRSAELYYGLAFFAALDGDLDSLRQFLEQAWKLKPISRQDILGKPVLAAVAALPEIFPIFHLSSADEPIVRFPTTSSEPILLAPSEEATLLGNHLTISTTGADLEIAGGGTLTPVGTRATDAATARRHAWQEAIDHLDDTVERARVNPATLARPRAVALATVLAEDHRWNDLARLTEAITENSVDRMPPALAKLRARALEELGRVDEARRILVALGLSDRLTKRRDPGTLYQLAESFVDQGDYELALKILERARRISPHGGRPNRIKQIQMEQALMADHSRYRKGNFEIVYPTSTSIRYPTAMAAVLEAERKRIARWVPLTTDGPPIEVHLYPLRAFLEAYSPGQGLLVLGLYDGRIRVPFADVASLNDRVVALISHELTHALIAQATDNQAPNWIQEGVAEHAQMRQDRLNPFPELGVAGRVLALPVVNAALSGFAEAQFVDLAYSESAWFVHWIEARYGAAGIKRLIAAFADASRTSEAIRLAFDLSVADFQEYAVTWATTTAPQVWAVEKTSYDGAFLDKVLADAQLLPPGRQPVLELRNRGQRGDRRLVDRPRTQAPKVRVREPIPTPRQQKPPGPGPLQIWHQHYIEASAQSKALLGELLRQRRGGTNVEIEICRELEGALRALRTGDALKAPQSQLRRHLENAYLKLHHAARACLAGKDSEVAASIEQAEEQLAHAARRLATTGLRP